MERALRQDFERTRRRFAASEKAFDERLRRRFTVLDCYELATNMKRARHNARLQQRLWRIVPGWAPIR
jgi:hypothetical protein